MTAALLHDAVGFVFTDADVQELVNESEEEAAAAAQPAASAPRHKR
jgi:hypothetical protein